MKIFKKGSKLNQFVKTERKTGKKIGFVPTMGALHKGHISLIVKSKKETALTICSIFINPTQFNNKSDLEKYPRTIEQDIALLIDAGCDVLYLPDENDIYTNGLNQLEDFDLSPLDNILEGASRPGHFKGVANVVKNLLQYVNPDSMYLGQKDFQQVMVLKRLIELTKFKTEVEVCEIVREENGLAMSSRNVRLTKEERKQAGKIYKSLLFVKENIGKNSNLKIIEYARSIVAEIDNSRIDYYKICDKNTLNETSETSLAGKGVCLVAVYIGEVRLIDNILL